jgi:hypothetical protein
VEDNSVDHEDEHSVRDITMKKSLFAIVASLVFGHAAMAAGVAGAAGAGVGVAAGGVSGSATVIGAGSSVSQSYNNQSVAVAVTPSVATNQAGNVNYQNTTTDSASITGSIVTNSNGGAINTSRCWSGNAERFR